jgi:CBS domain-containing protein
VREKIGILVVTSPRSGEMAEAVLSERDIVRAVAAGMKLSIRAWLVATKKLVRVNRSERPSKAVKLMMENGIRHLVVDNDDGTLFGVLSMRDFFREKRLLESFTKGDSDDVPEMN